MNNTIEIKLTKGKVALIDRDDADRVRPYNWYATSHGYVAAYLKRGDKSAVYLHRFLTGATVGVQVDHINGDKLDNRKSNLRFCTRSENLANRPKPSNGMSSRYKGVTFNKKRGVWLMHICRKGFHYRKAFFSENEAAQHYNERAIELFGEFAKLNEIEEADRIAPAINKPIRKKLNKDLVKQIRERLAKNESLTALAKDFDVSISTVCLIRQNKTWQVN